MVGTTLPLEHLWPRSARMAMRWCMPRSWTTRMTSQTGLRNSEITAVRRQDVELGVGAHVRCLGKGRKSRCTPLRPDVIAILKAWLSRHSGGSADPLFPSARGGRRLSADGVQRLVARHVATASRTCPSLKAKKVTPHTLRHAAAMALLRRGVDLTVIALWLGHESSETTQVCLHADMRIKERALAHATPSGVTPKRYRPIRYSPFSRDSDYAARPSDTHSFSLSSRRPCRRTRHNRAGGIPPRNGRCEGPS